MNTNQKFCNQCGRFHDRDEVKRTLGKESGPYQGGFCSARCFTLNITNKENPPTPIAWIPVAAGKLPEPSKRGHKETSSEGASDRMLVMCKDGQERFARYYNQTHLASDFTFWNVEGCAGQPKDFVTHYAYLTLPAQK